MSDCKATPHQTYCNTCMATYPAKASSTYGANVPIYTVSIPFAQNHLQGIVPGDMPQAHDWNAHLAGNKHHTTTTLQARPSGPCACVHTSHTQHNRSLNINEACIHSLATTLHASTMISVSFNYSHVFELTLLCTHL